MRRRRINLTKESLSKWFVKMRRRYLNDFKRDYSYCVNYEFD